MTRGCGRIKINLSKFEGSNLLSEDAYSRGTLLSGQPQELDLSFFASSHFKKYSSRTMAQTPNIGFKDSWYALTIDVGPAIFAIERKLDECRRALRFLVITRAQDRCDEDVLVANVVKVFE
ncbi:hypothetical protein G6F37_004657 [Rhizopus arrhizus]|nr:hypothetical protein G6F38_002416 [Rhizopus arrhizus]KAG1159702.1 hypothetical protein G6F37_004657 [Rhizopus arrhizus]